MLSGFPVPSQSAMDCTCCSLCVPYSLRIPAQVAYQSYTSDHLRTKIHFPDAFKPTMVDGVSAEERDQGAVMFRFHHDSRHVFPGSHSFKTQFTSGLSPSQLCHHDRYLTTFPSSKTLLDSPIYPRTFCAKRIHMPFTGDEGTYKRSLAFPVQRLIPSPWSSSESPGVNSERKLSLNGHPSAFTRTGSRSRRYSRHQNAWGGPTYTELITKAILSTSQRRMTLASIYEWISDHVPYFAERKDCKTSEGWKNAIRHTLSLRKRFIRVPKTDGGSTSWYSSWWTVSEQYLTKQAILSGDLGTIQEHGIVFSSFQASRTTLEERSSKIEPLPVSTRKELTNCSESIATK